MQIKKDRKKDKLYFSGIAQQNIKRNNKKYENMQVCLLKEGQSYQKSKEKNKENLRKGKCQ